MGYIKNVADIFSLKEHREELIAQGIIGKEKNTDKLLEAIEKAKQNDAYKLLTGLGIPNVGKAAAKAIMKHFKTMERLSEASEEELTGSRGHRKSQCGLASEVIFRMRRTRWCCRDSHRAGRQHDGGRKSETVALC